MSVIAEIRTEANKHVMKQFKPQKMVGWYEVKQLAGTAIRAVLSSIFGTYADKRESLAALFEEEVYTKYGDSDSDELWFDYISDTGDGFDSTFSMAKLISMGQLHIPHGDEFFDLKRGDLMMLGGDEVYPTPTKEEYFNRFTGPFEAASTQNDSDRVTDMYALPGNHDWYDGLANFVNIFLHKRRIGTFQTVQNRSYFAVKLTKNTWLWALDIQLTADLDDSQIIYYKCFIYIC